MFISLRIKISLALILTSLSFIGVYTLVAKNTFESDKISYIYESLQTQTENHAQKIDDYLNRVTSETRGILNGYDASKNQLSINAKKMFDESLLLLAIQTKSTSRRFSVEKKSGDIDKFQNQLTPVAYQQSQITFLDQDHFAIQIGLKNERFEDLELLIIATGLFHQLSFTENVKTVIYNDKKILAASRADLMSDEVYKKIMAQSQSGNDLYKNQTRRGLFFGQDSLISHQSVYKNNIQMISWIEYESAMGALKILFQRSIVFLIMTFFAALVVAILISNRMTKNILHLTWASQKLGQGDFNVEYPTQTRDEVGLLSKAFQKMTQEIKRLLSETADKARMEQELKTTRLVQDSLFPQSESYQKGILSLTGIYKTTSECGGDWWYYYAKGSDLYVFLADATGHGTPAALITAVARSLFTELQEKTLSLPEIAASWDRAIHLCSNKKIFMTAFMLKINTDTGVGTCLCAAHESPVLLKPTGKEDKLSAEYLELDQNHRLGQNKSGWNEHPFHLQKGERLLIYSDGLTSIQSPEGKSYGEKRFLKVIEKTISAKQDSKQTSDKIYKFFDDFGQGAQLPDDVTMIMLHADEHPVWKNLTPDEQIDRIN